MTDVKSGAGMGATQGGAVDACPLWGRKAHATEYPRNKAARRAALKRDAIDSSSDLSAAARTFIIRHDGYKVPKGYEVSHEEPLYTMPNSERCKLDTADNMKTQPKPKHRERHDQCGDQFHDYPVELYKHLW